VLLANDLLRNGRYSLLVETGQWLSKSVTQSSS
jgi:hypothetical protein